MSPTRLVFAPIMSLTLLLVALERTHKQNAISFIWVTAWVVQCVAGLLFGTIRSTDIWLLSSSREELILEVLSAPAQALDGDSTPSARRFLPTATLFEKALEHLVFGQEVVDPSRYTPEEFVTKVASLDIDAALARLNVVDIPSRI